MTVAPPLPFVVTLDTTGPLAGFESVDMDSDLFVPINAGILEAPATQAGVPIPWLTLSRANLATCTLGPSPMFVGTATVKTKTGSTNRVNIDLASRAKILVDCAPPTAISIPAGTLAAVTQLLCGSLAVPVAPSAGAAVPRLDPVAPGRTEPVWSTLTNLAKEAGCWVWCDSMGLIHVEPMAPFYAKPPVDILTCAPAPASAANNILDYTLRDDGGDRFSHIVVHGAGSQRALQGNAATGLLAAPVFGLAVDPDLASRGVYRPLVLEDGAARNIAQAQARALREMMIRRVEGLKIECEVAGWTTTLGVPWDITQMVQVNIPADGVVGPRMIAGRRFVLNKTSGRRTRLTLIEPFVL